MAFSTTRSASTARPKFRPVTRRTTPIQASLDNGLHFIATHCESVPERPAARRKARPADCRRTSASRSRSTRVNRVQPYSQRWTFDVQRTFFKDVLMVDAGYVGNKAIHLGVDRNINATPNQYLSTSPFRDQATINALSATVPNPFFGINPHLPEDHRRRRSAPAVSRIRRHHGDAADRLLLVSRIAGARREALRTALHVRRQLHILEEHGGHQFPERRRPGGEPLDQPAGSPAPAQHSTASWNCPFGRGKLVRQPLPRRVDAVVGGWQVNNIFTYQTGAPLGFGNIIFNGDLHDIPLSSGERSVNGGSTPRAGFVTASAQQLASNIRTFPKCLAGVRGDGQTDWNAVADQAFPIKERVNLEFRFEGYDIMNHPNFSDPNTTVTSCAFGTMTSQAGLSREFQGAMRLTF